MAVDPRQEAVLLRDDELGISTESTPRAVQLNGEDYRKITLNANWLEQLNISEPGSQTVHSLSVGRKPVVVQNPAIIIQPMAALEVDE